LSHRAEGRSLFFRIGGCGAEFIETIGTVLTETPNPDYSKSGVNVFRKAQEILLEGEKSRRWIFTYIIAQFFVTSDVLRHKAGIVGDNTPGRLIEAIAHEV